jgi:glycosyltransferase involved in cell wall biosynthesis
MILLIHNECGNLQLLSGEPSVVFDEDDNQWEVLFVDEDSTNGSFETLKQIRDVGPRFNIVKFRDNFRQSVAMDAELDYGSGEVVDTMDSDGQKAPIDIPKLIESYNCVTSWWKDRDYPLLNWVSSRFISGLREMFFETGLHDYGCELKTFSRPAPNNIFLDDETYRCITALLSRRGHRVSGVQVNHRLWRDGKTKYFCQRLSNNVLDLVDTWFWQISRLNGTDMRKTSNHIKFKRF